MEINRLEFYINLLRFASHREDIEEAVLEIEKETQQNYEELWKASH